CMTPSSERLTFTTTFLTRPPRQSAARRRDGSPPARRDPRFHDLPDERRGKRLVRGETDRPLARVVARELLLEGLNDRAGIERAVLRAGAEAHQEPAAQPVWREC